MGTIALCTCGICREIRTHDYNTLQIISPISSVIPIPQIPVSDLSANKLMEKKYLLCNQKRALQLLEFHTFILNDTENLKFVRNFI